MWISMKIPPGVRLAMDRAFSPSIPRSFVEIMLKDLSWMTNILQGCDVHVHPVWVRFATIHAMTPWNA